MSSIFAYLDPGSGSLILQALLGGAAGLAVGARLFGRRVVYFLMFWKRDEDPAPEQPAASAVDES